MHIVKLRGKLTQLHPKLIVMVLNAILGLTTGFLSREWMLGQSFKALGASAKIPYRATLSIDMGRSMASHCSHREKIENHWMVQGSVLRKHNRKR
jgi:hypothetical protein